MNNMTPVYPMTAAIGILLMAVYRVFRKRASPEPAPVPSAVEDYGTPVAFV
jgi:hypothetical protein